VSARAACPALLFALLAQSAAAECERPAEPKEATAPRTALQDPTPDELPAATNGRAAESALALERGLAWLAKRQDETGDGSFPAAGAQQNVPVPVAALAALAFMAGGSTPERGPYGRELGLAIDYLLGRADMTPGSPTRGYLAAEGDNTARMHGHAFATLALAQAWSMSPRSPRGRRIEDVLRAATALIERCQGLEGGWEYEPAVMVAQENSVTVVLVQALRAARGAGVSVDSDVIAKAVDYIGRCQAEDGSFRYALTQGETSIALTAAGITTLHSAGVYSGGEVERGMEALWRRLGYRDERGEAGLARFPCYERFYLAQALWQQSDQRLFERWYEEEQARVLDSQQDDGSWLGAHDEQAYGSCYATAMNCLFLALPEGLLPIFQR
jgi:hypothetical protein